MKRSTLSTTHFMWITLLLGIVSLSCQKANVLHYNNEAQLNKLKTQKLETIAFGSCNRQDMEQPLWEDIQQNDPQLWIWLGDNIYGDSENPVVLKRKYDQQKRRKDYKDFIQNRPVIGIWDDHDYGVNNGGKEYPGKNESKKQMFEFLEVPKDNPAWQREGAYQSYSFGPNGQRIKVILLDSRTFRDLPTRDDNGYIPNPGGDILGEDQWVWFESEIENSDADIHLIANGIQLIPEDHEYEKWANFPTARNRFFNLLKKYKLSNVILLSGDRHLGEFSKIKFQDSGIELLEITSSGMTHSYSSFTGEPNRHRVGQVVSSLNFGLMKIKWGVDQVDLTIELRGLKNQILQFQQISLPL